MTKIDDALEARSISRRLTLRAGNVLLDEQNVAAFCSAALSRDVAQVSLFYIPRVASIPSPFVQPALGAPNEPRHDKQMQRAV